MVKFIYYYIETFEFRALPFATVILLIFTYASRISSRIGTSHIDVPLYILLLVWITSNLSRLDIFLHKCLISYIMMSGYIYLSESNTRHTTRREAITSSLIYQNTTHSDGVA